MNAPRATLTAILLFLLALLVLAGLTWANYRFAVENPGGNDFLARWNGARSWLLEGVSPYDERVSLETQRLIYGRAADPEQGEDVAHFVYPLPSMLFFGPFGLLEYNLARALWMTLLEFSLAALALVSLNLVGWRATPWTAAGMVLFSLAWYHGTRTILVGQFAGVNALLIALALLLLRQHQDVPAGALLALSLAKPQMVFLLIPLVLLWALSVGRHGVWGGFFVTTLVLMAASLALIPDWPVQMFRQILDYPDYTNIGSPLSIVADAAPGIRTPLNVGLHAALFLILFWTWFAVWKKDYRVFLWTALLTIVITNLVAFRTATTNYVMMLPALLMILRVWRDRWGRLGLGLVWMTLVVLGIGLWALFLATVEGNVEQPVMYLPFPFICFFGLWWARWWTVRPPRMLYEELSARLKL